MSATKQEAILAFAANISKHTPRRRGLKPVVQKKDLFVPLSRFNELMSIREALERGLLKGKLEQLNRKAHSSELKAVKLPGVRGWQVLPEWIEEFNNEWIRNYNGKRT